MPAMSELIPQHAVYWVAALAYGPFLVMIAVWLAAALLRLGGRPHLYDWLRARLFSIAAASGGRH